MPQSRLSAVTMFLFIVLFVGCSSGPEAAIPPPFTPADDVQFIDGMVPHHQGAVMMADMIVQRGQRADLRAMAQQMKDSQNQEIAMMRSARQAIAGSTDTPPMSDPHMLSDMMLLSQQSGAQLDTMFMEHMIPHHAGAIIMAHRALPNLKLADMHALAAHIVDAQALEIGELQRMLTAP